MSKRLDFVSFEEYVPGSPPRPRNYDPSRLYPRPLTDDEVLERNKFLKAENARLKEWLCREQIKLWRQQMALKGNKNRG